MSVSSNTSVFQNRRDSRTAVVAAVILSCLVLVAGCARRVSYSVQTVYADHHFSGRMLSNNEIAVLPLITSWGPLTAGQLEPGRLLKAFKPLRPDLTFVSLETFEKAFPSRFDRREIAEFYGRIYREEILPVKSMDSLWHFVAQPYLLIFTLREGAVIHNMDGSVFKHVSVVCELWSRDSREVVWRASCRGVSDDRRVVDGEILAESIRRLAQSVPAAAPDYGRYAREVW